MLKNCRFLPFLLVVRTNCVLNMYFSLTSFCWHLFVVTKYFTMSNFWRWHSKNNRTSGSFEYCNWIPTIFLYFYLRVSRPIMKWAVVGPAVFPPSLNHRSQRHQQSTILRRRQSKWKSPKTSWLHGGVHGQAVAPQLQVARAAVVHLPAARERLQRTPTTPILQPGGLLDKLSR